MSNLEIIKDNAFNQNSYLISYENKNIVIDPGYNYEKIKKSLGSKKLDAIFLTHYHFDHVACVDKLCSDYHIKAYIHQDDLPYLIKNTLSTDFGFAPIEITSSNVVTFKNNIQDFEWIKVLNLPGHSEGSVAYQINKWLFTGDVLFKDGVGRTDITGSNNDKHIRSLELLSTLPGDLIVYPGHGDFALLEDIKKGNRFW